MNATIECPAQLDGKPSNLLRQNVEGLISEAVDNSFSLFGDTFKTLAYNELEKTFQIKKQEIPYRINEFTNAIEEICGAGAKIIEMKIIQALHKKVKGFVYVARGEDLVFTDYVESLRQYL